MKFLLAIVCLLNVEAIRLHSDPNEQVLDARKNVANERAVSDFHSNKDDVDYNKQEAHVAAMENAGAFKKGFALEGAMLAAEQSVKKLKIALQDAHEDAIESLCKAGKAPP